MNQQALVPTFGSSEARRLTDEVKRDAEVLWRKLVELYEGGAHTALGYSSWGAYFEAEFAQSGRRGYQLLDAGRVLESVNHGSTAAPNERQARELLPLLDEPEKLRETWADVQELHPEPTAEIVRAAVDKKLRPRTESENVLLAGLSARRDELVRARGMLARAYENAGRLVADFLEHRPDEDRERVCRQVAPHTWQALEAAVRKQERRP